MWCAEATIATPINPEVDWILIMVNSSNSMSNFILLRQQWSRWWWRFIIGRQWADFWVTRGFLQIFIFVWWCSDRKFDFGWWRRMAKCILVVRRGGTKGGWVVNSADNALLNVYLKRSRKGCFAGTGEPDADMARCIFFVGGHCAGACWERATTGCIRHGLELDASVQCCEERIGIEFPNDKMEAHEYQVLGHYNPAYHRSESSGTSQEPAFKSIKHQRVKNIFQTGSFFFVHPLGSRKEER